jgi:hypothetical protein
MNFGHNGSFYGRDQMEKCFLKLGEEFCLKHSHFLVFPNTWKSVLNSLQDLN